MKVKHHNLFLYLALACFLGIILIFIFDGYSGVYDSLVINNGRYLQTIEYEQWAREAKYGSYPGVSVDRGGQVDFTYTIENHRFSAYTGNVEVLLWSSKAKITDILHEQISIPPFAKKELKWTVKTADIIPESYPAEQSYYINVKINTNDIRRNINLNVNAYLTPDGIKVIPVPTP